MCKGKKKQPIIQNNRPFFSPKTVDFSTKNIFSTKKYLFSQIFIIPLHADLYHRDVAQLVAHYVRDVGVGRSSRLIPTTKAGETSKSSPRFCLSTPPDFSCIFLTA